MSELKFPLYFRLGALYFRWDAPQKYLKSFNGGISECNPQVYTFADWITDNPTAQQITHHEYQTHIDALMESLNQSTKAPSPIR